MTEKKLEHTFDERRDAFHKHLDGCKRCRENPMNLCGTVDALLRSAVPTPEELLGRSPS